MKKVMLIVARNNSLFFKFVLLVPILIVFFVKVGNAREYISESNKIELNMSSFGEPLQITDNWKFKRGDNLTWARANYDDKDWEKIEITRSLGSQSYQNFEGFAWYRLKINFRQTSNFDEKSSLSVLINRIHYASYEIYVGGKLLGQEGKLASFSETAEPTSKTYSFSPKLINKNGELVIAIRLWQIPIRKGSADYGGFKGDLFYIGNTKVLENYNQLFFLKLLQNSFYVPILTIIFFLVAIYHLNLYQKRKDQIEYFWFALVSISCGINLICFSGFVWLLSIFNYFTLIKITHISYVTGIILGIRFLWSFCGTKAPIYLNFYSIVYLLLLFSKISSNNLYIIFDKFVLFENILDIFFLVTSGNFLIKKVLNGNLEAKTILIGCIIVIISQLSEILRFFSTNINTMVSCNCVPAIGFGTVILFMAISFSNRFSRVYKELDLLNQDLEKKVIDRTQKLTESEKRALEANQAKSIFLAFMSHELRTPLNAILGFAQIMDRKLKDNSSEILDYVKNISRSGEHLLKLINDILCISKIEAGKVFLREENFNLEKMLSDLVAIFQSRAESKFLKFNFKAIGTLPTTVFGDEGKLRQVLTNLLGNALKFTAQGEILLEVKYQQPKAYFRITDTGCGISNEDLNKLFEPFSQATEGEKLKEGTGLGLFISRKFINMMGGEIIVSSQLNKSTTFYFEINLPISEKNLVETKRRVLKLLPNQPNYKMLIVDNQAGNRVVLRLLLETVGFQVIEANNGEEAVEIWQKDSPAMIWMDIRMPIMDGFTTTRLIREIEKSKNLKPTIIIAFTASVFEHEQEAIHQVGCDDFVSKPFYESVIFEKISQYLKVEYEYKNEQTFKNDTNLQSSENVSLEALSSLPKTLTIELYQTLLSGKITATQELVKQIEKENKTLATHIEKMINSLQFDKLLSKIESLSN